MCRRRRRSVIPGSLGLVFSNRPSASHASVRGYLVGRTHHWHPKLSRRVSFLFSVWYEGKLRLQIRSGSGLHCVSLRGPQSLARDNCWHALVRKDASRIFLSSVTTFAHFLDCASRSDLVYCIATLLQDECDYRESHGCGRASRLRQPRQRRRGKGLPSK